MPSQLSDDEWARLLTGLERGAFTPFLGPGILHGRVPLPGDIALRWAEEGNYPLEDKWNLARVAQFMALEKGARWPRDELVLAMTGASAEVDEKNDVFLALADLPFRTYITTTPDELLVRALRGRMFGREDKRALRRPRADFCRWHDALRSSSLPTTFEADPHYVPSAEEPFVFSLYGQIAVAESLVLTEDDHFDLLVSTARHPWLIPPPVQRALRGGPLLFLGHPLSDWNFRVLLRSLCGADFSGLQAGTVSVHVAPPDTGEDVLRFLEKFFGRLHIQVYWGTPQEFLHELRERREAT
jgi:hypothetical protein